MTHNLRHKEHIDKKEKLEAGSVTTKASTHDYYARKMHATEDHPGSIEEGKIFFFYRPRIGLQEAHSIEDIQRFYMVMLPLSRPAPVRLVVVGKEHLPEHGQRFWAAVLAVGKTMDDVLKRLGPREDLTKTRGTRLTPSARAVGEGIYVLFDNGAEVDLLYELEIPHYPHEAQEQLGIYKTGAFTIQVKNPYRPSPPGLGLGKKADYPPELQKEFEEGARGCRTWVPFHNPELLDYPDAEFLLIGHSHDLEGKTVLMHKGLKELLEDTIKRDLGAQQYADVSEEDAAMLDKLKQDISADIYHIDIKPVIQGELE